MKTLVILLEELSAKEMLRQLLPRQFPNSSEVEFKLITFEGKQDLIREVERKIRGWKSPNSAFLVLVDQDGSDCVELKAKFTKKCQHATQKPFKVRIACHELENWYLGDLHAIQKVFGDSIDTQKNQKKYLGSLDKPDKFANAAEELSKLTNKRYRKVSGSVEIGKVIDPSRNKSRSFKIFLQGIKSLLDSLEV